MTQVRTKLMAAALVTLGLGLAAARADNPAPGGKAGRPVNPKITVEQLGEMLEAMGYTIVEPIRNKDNQTIGYRIEVKAGTWTIRPRMILDNTTVWALMGLEKMPDPNNPPVANLLKLLAANSKTGPAYFTLYENGTALGLELPVPNHYVTPAVLRKQVEQLCEAFVSTEDLWDTSKWPKPGASVSAAPPGK